MLLQMILLILAFGPYSALANTFLTEPQGTSPHIAGPNCWNQALMSVSLLEVPRFTSDEEFLYLLNKHCTQVQNPTYGSLGRMSDQEGEVHAFIWISDSEVYAKNSLGAFETPRFMPFQEMLDTYLRHEECMPTSTSPVCIRQTSYYDCHEIRPEIKSQNLELRPLELTLQRLVYSPETMSRPRHSCNSDFLNARFELLQNFIEQLEVFNVTSLRPEPDYLKTWMISALDQIEEIEFSTYSESCLESDLTFKNNFKIFNTLQQKLISLMN